MKYPFNGIFNNTKVAFDSESISNGRLEALESSYSCVVLAPSYSAPFSPIC